MGQEIRCSIDHDGVRADGRAQLETEEVIFRIDKRVVVPFRKLTSIDVNGDALQLAWDSHRASLHLGAATAAKWADRIRNPKSRLDKIGIKPKQRVSVVGIDDADLLTELERRDVDASTRIRNDSDVIFYGAATRAALSRLAALKEALRPNGALWIIRPKGSPDITEAEVMSAGKAAGLVDVKVVKFSDTHTAEKFVIPVKAR
jgi:hypothetical protein